MQEGIIDFSKPAPQKPAPPKHAQKIDGWMTYGDCGSFHGYSQASEFNNFARRLIEAGLPLRPDVSYLCANDLVYGLQFILDHGLIKEFTTTRRMDTMTTVYRWR